jgi:hypothetical protein
MSNYPFRAESNAESMLSVKEGHWNGQLLSDPLVHLGRMNRWKLWTDNASQERLIARFGTGRLVHCDGARYELRGGNDWDFAAAQEWVAHFLHEAVIDRPAVPQGCAQRRTSPECPRPKSFGRGTLR